MPSPISTGGFSVSVMPNGNFADPRLLVPRYGDIIPSFMQGSESRNRLLQIAEEEKMRPIKAQLAQIQLENAPIEAALQRARLAEAQQNAAVPRYAPGDISIEDQTQVYPAALGEDGQPTGEPDKVLGDLVQVTSGTAYGPGGVATPYTRRQTLKTAAQRADEEAMKAAQVESIKALANQRNRGKQYEFTQLADLRDAALAEGDAEGAAMYDSRIKRLTQLNPEFRTVASGVDENGKLIINQVDTSGNLRSIETGQKKNSGNDWIAQISNNLAALAQKGGTSSPVATPGIVPASNPTVTLTVDQARAAKPGTKFLGTDGRARIKNADGTVSIIVE